MFLRHRLMHTYPKLYKHHKVHHEYKQNSILSSQHFNPIDYLFSITGPAILTSALVRPHGITQLQIGLWLVTANLDDHLGYAFPWSPVRWFPLWVWNSTVLALNCLLAYWLFDTNICIFLFSAAGTDAHEFHHGVNMGFYGHKFTLCDHLFGTDKVYKQWRIKFCQTIKKM